MRIMVITAAGEATRFNRERKEPVLKAVYRSTENGVSILDRLVGQGKGNGCDKIILVGGYRFEELEQWAATRYKGPETHIELVFNPLFKEYGTMYSLFLGLNKAREYQPDEIIFAEGDLIVDDASFSNLLSSETDAISINREPIFADRAVVICLDGKDKLHYLYDKEHCLLQIPYPVKAVFNSGQIWKFCDAKRLFALNDRLSEEDRKGTNLILIQGYFGEQEDKTFRFIMLEQWFNCNTPSDYEKGMQCVAGSGK